ncbi:hypothetical protein [Acinetobacter pittii]|uniref:hypothetical protein n=1 Tax=Acinetobacter pittii TaxID=48296 RepID=UPI00249E8FF6|nr:hypothetical protein [Acinetobacter pittii]WHA51999.1 hypothetical protein OH685_01900 [Acinetobacter pittii]
MSMNHHMLAKTTTESVLANFKTGSWRCLEENIGPSLYRIGCDSIFPSPDASFYDPNTKKQINFEFKPDTETKRGILTGLGQTIAYLKKSHASFLIIPEYIEDFPIANYMDSIFSDVINNKLSIGLIAFDNKDPKQVRLLKNVKISNDLAQISDMVNSRFWAKHQDLPIPLFHLILHCFYLKKIHIINSDAFAYCWDKYLAPQSILTTLTPETIVDIQGVEIKTVAGTKEILFFEKTLNKIRKMAVADQVKAIQKIKKDMDTTFIGDNYFNSVKKNFITFCKHVKVIDSNYELTELGVKMYHLGVVNGPNSRLFKDYFLNLILLNGKHLDLIFDLDKLSTDPSKYNLSFETLKSELEADYEVKGMIRRNVNRQASSSNTVNFLKYETILWRSLDILVTQGNRPVFNWKKIVEVCSLPEL